MRTLALVIALTLSMALAAYAGEVTWETPWSQARPYSLTKCAEIFDTFQMQKVCLDNERDGYNALQGDYGMPKKITRRAKTKCAEIFDTFQMRHVCMQNEASGYKALYKH